METLLTRIMGRQDYQVNRSSSKFKCNLSDTDIDSAESPIKRDTTEEEEKDFGAPAGAGHRCGADSATSAASGASGCSNNSVSGYDVNIAINHNNSHAELIKLASVHNYNYKRVIVLHLQCMH